MIYADRGNRLRLRFKIFLILTFILEIGTKLKIPVEPEWSPRYSIEEFRKMTGKELKIED